MKNIFKNIWIGQSIEGGSGNGMSFSKSEFINRIDLNSFYKVDEVIRDDIIYITIYDKQNKLFHIGGNRCNECGTITIYDCKNFSGNYNKDNYIHGLGSAVMERFLSICKTCNIEKITGEFSEYEWMDKTAGIKKITNFYNKFGFTVFINKVLKQGRIELLLD